MRPVNIVIVTRAGNGDLIIWALNIRGYRHELPVQDVLTGRFLKHTQEGIGALRPAPYAL